MRTRKQKRHTIYVGLSIGEDEERKIGCQQAGDLVARVCRAYGTPFSMTQQRGGYIHWDGQYVVEDSLAVSLIGLPWKQVREIAKDLCCFFQQESVLIVRDKVASHSVTERILLSEFET